MQALAPGQCGGEDGSASTGTGEGAGTSTGLGGHRVLRMPTTMPANAANGTEDAWIYMDDFAMANSEDALPTY